MEYTSSEEFDLVKRVQITNEVPPLSLWATLPAGLKNPFWEYFVGKSTVIEDVPLVNDENRPFKIVNGVKAKEYGPLLRDEDKVEGPWNPDAETFHQLEVEGVVLPEYDLMLHEVYRYLDALYPDHPDFEILLTATEIDEAFRSAAAIIGYTPDYKFLDAWINSITGNSLTREGLKWKIRDLRSIAFRRKLYGSYLGYKTAFSSIHRHGSVYVTGTYVPRDSKGNVDYSDSRALKKFRLVDVEGENQKYFNRNAAIKFKGIVEPEYTNRVYDYQSSSLSRPHDTILDQVRLGGFLQTDKAEGVTARGFNTVEGDQYTSYYIESSIPLTPSCREYELEGRGTIALAPSPTRHGGAAIPLCAALSIYESDLPGTTTALDSLTWNKALRIGDIVVDRYTDIITTYEDKAVVTDIERGILGFVINPATSPVIEEFPKLRRLDYGVEFDIKEYTQSGDIISPTIHKVFMQGSLEFTIDTQGKPVYASLAIANIPMTHPITGEENRSHLLNASRASTIQAGTFVGFLERSRTSEGFVWEYYERINGWVDKLSWGVAVLNETMYKSEAFPDRPFPLENFESWKLRAAGDYATDKAINDSLEIIGEVSAEVPYIIVVDNVSEKQKLASISVGDGVRGVGLASGVIVSSVTSDSFQLSAGSAISGEIKFTVDLKTTRSSNTSRLLDFKTELYSTYPEDTTSIFTGLWPSPMWPQTSKIYVEGMKDTSLFQIPDRILESVEDPSGVLFDKTIFVEVSLDRMLYHSNSAGFKMAGSPACLMDIPWMEYLTDIVKSAQRATEEVRVGSQLSLSTDTSGLYTIIAANKYTDPNINLKFTVLPKNYDLDSEPAYIQLGMGGHEAARQKLFVSISDLLRPPVYGASLYDGNTIMSGTQKINRRGVYAISENQNASGGDPNAIDPNDGLVDPIFEVPLGEYEYNPNLVDPNNENNIYQSIFASVYSQEFRNIPLSGHLTINSPYLMMGEQLPRDLYTYKGNWNPMENPEIPQTPLWPRGTFVDRDYYLVGVSTYIGTHEFSAGDWLIYNSITGRWDRREWMVLGEWPPANMAEAESYTSPPNYILADYLESLGISIGEALDRYLIYFIASKDFALVGTEGNIQVAKDDWIILTKETYINDDALNSLMALKNNKDDKHLAAVGADGKKYQLAYVRYQPWLVAGGRTYEIIKQNFSKGVLSLSSYGALANQRQELIDNTMQISPLPRKFLSRGSCGFTLRLDPGYVAKDTDGVEYNLTEDVIKWDRLANLFYVINIEANGVATKHFVDFKEPKYFKNLLSLVGTVSAESPQIVKPYGGVDFLSDSLSLTDRVISSNRVYVRNEFSEVRENKYFSLYVDISGQVDPDNRYILRPALDSPRADERREEFRIALQGMAPGDVVKSSAPAVLRTFEKRFENRYFKNLMLVYAKVNRDDPTILIPIDDTDEAMRSMSECNELLVTGDYVSSMFIPGGAVYTYQFSGDAMPGEAGIISNICFGDGTWVVSGDNKELSISENGLDQDWLKTSLPPEWLATSKVNKIYFSNSTEAFWAVGEKAQIAKSLDSGFTWNPYIIDADWGNAGINDIASSSADGDLATSSNIVIVGNNGKVAYLDEGFGNDNWTISTLPKTINTTLTEEEQANNPPPEGVGISGTAAGWDNYSVNCVGYGNFFWMVGGENGSIAKTDRITDVELDGASNWSMMELPEAWDTTTIKSIKYFEETWVIIGTDISNQTGRIAYSKDDGSTWVEVLGLACKGFNALDWNAGQWIAVGNKGVVYTSLDGKSWAIKSISGTSTDTDLYAVAVGDAATLFGGNSRDLFISSSEIKSLDTISVIPQEGENSRFQIKLSADVLAEDAEDWGADTSKKVLISFFTLRSIDSSLIGIPSKSVATLVNPATGQFYIPASVEVSTFENSNRVYMPRNDIFLTTEILSDGTQNTSYLGPNGYPAYEEDPSQYLLDEEEQPEDFTNEEGYKIYRCDYQGNYLDVRSEKLKPTDFYQANSVEDGKISLEYLSPAVVQQLPLYPSYLDWLEVGSDIIKDLTNIFNFGDGATARIVDIINFKDEDPYLVLDREFPPLMGEYNAVSLGILPNNPTPIPLDGVPHYAIDKNSANNKGLMAFIQNEEVYYNVDPFENATVLDTSGSNKGLQIAGEGDNTLYSISPIKSAPAEYVQNVEENKPLLTIDNDGNAFYTLSDDAITGISFHQEGYGSWQGKAPSSELPWESDPNAFYGEDTDGDGLIDSFIFLKNTRQDSIFLCAGSGTLIRDSEGNPIPVPAPKCSSFEELLNTSGNIVEREDLDALGNTVASVGESGAYFILERAISFDANEIEKQVRLNVLTLASIDVNEETKTNPALVYPLTVTELATYGPDRVCYRGSAYPTFVENPDLYNAGDFTNKNGSRVYHCDEAGNYISEVESHKSTQVLSERISPYNPRYQLCQAWYSDEFHIEGREDNPYWQYVSFEDYLDIQSKEWKQRARMYKLVKGEFQLEMMPREIPEEEGYVKIHPGLAYQTEVGNMVVSTTDFIQHADGRLNCILVSNPAYDILEDPLVDKKNTKYGLSYASTFQKAKDLQGNSINMFDTNKVVQTRMKCEWVLNYTVNSTKNYADPHDKVSSRVAITEVGVFNKSGRMIAYGTFPPVIYDAAEHHMSLNLSIKRGDFTPLLPDQTN